jgi:hypothetical protein
MIRFLAKAAPSWLGLPGPWWHAIANGASAETGATRLAIAAFLASALGRRRKTGLKNANRGFARSGSWLIQRFSHITRAIGILEGWIDEQ